MYTSCKSIDLQSRHRNLLPREEYLRDSTPMVSVYTLSLDVEAKDYSMDGFTISITTLTNDEPKWMEGAKNKALLVIHTIFQPLKISDPLNKDDTFSL